ncbi:4-hydroxyphenylpyruvate dioxygenase [Streptomyces phaeochromogenes]|uniref:4-hydroxyphenylpyruvate dioxygenase n=1 Tax=Streptomyces phaeochromogenes TaxID=1923 RepID=UPI00340FB2E3
MAVHDVGYIELYTSSKKSVIDYFVSSMGFRKIADQVGAERSSALLRHGTVQLIVTTGPAAWKFLDSHGDGIVDIALTCDDVEQTAQAAAAAGATVTGSVRGNPKVVGFGSVVHTLLPRTDSTDLPPGHNWVVEPDAPNGPHTDRIQLLDHIAVCLEGGSIPRYTDFYRDVFGMSPYSSEYVDVGEHAMDSTVVRNSSGGITFTLVAPDTGKGQGQLDAFLERNGGPGVQHLAFLVDSIIPVVGEFRDRGVEFLTIPDAYYDSLDERLPDMHMEIATLRSAKVLVDRDEWGHLLQLFSRSPYERNTLFYELIERRGSRGFGSANIRALYEAVEHDRLASE